jgi:hypothetical protein
LARSDADADEANDDDVPCMAILLLLLPPLLTLPLLEPAAAVVDGNKTLVLPEEGAVEPADTATSPATLWFPLTTFSSSDRESSLPSSNNKASIVLQYPSVDKRRRTKEKNMPSCLLY